MKPQLILHLEQGDRSVSLINATAWTVGRSEDSAIILDDTWASRNHAVLQIMESKLYVIDLGSLNGTFVNGKRVNIPIVLNNGDKITFATTESHIFFEEQVTIEAPAIQKQKKTVMLHHRQLITVLVVDIRDFTVLARRLEEKVLSQVIGTWFGKATEIINSYGSWVDKYIGDAVMAVWVHKTTDKNIKVNPNEILEVFQALYALHQMTDNLNREFSLPMQLRVGAGINTGNATVGQLGAGNRPEYTAIGDTVNYAFRLESATKAIGADIAIGELTYNYGHDSQLLQFKQHQVMLKGYDTPTNTFAGKFADLKKFLDQVVVPSS
ncbi:family 3 adenylate cyclase [Synechococcus sp. PCC 7502]|uniref:adenylate/guanylate cyclase domain-containing protein n=1 Tax=Synechococcus sp. PCC 7502 TaxID=1173263 RepID=UPI00029FB784|nr:adenylate/guanylate cyclase domain-containing protein [Synechococcus sp. PCC 7502]AFY75002.1 family 3 adenylate cyclase [Synechococcus sp. PCC 7502]